MTTTELYDLLASNRRREYNAKRRGAHVVQLEVCPDCACWIANADDSSMDLYDDAEDRRIHRDEVLSELGTPLAVSDAEQWFSWATCDLCDCAAGERLAVHSV